MPFPRFALVCCGGLFASKQQKPRQAQTFPGWKIEKQAGRLPFLFQMLRKTPAGAGSPADTLAGVAEE